MGDERCITRRAAVSAILSSGSALALAGCSYLPTSIISQTRTSDVPFNAAVFYYSYEDSYIGSVREALSADDWKRIKDEVGYEAENLPLDLLSAMMKTVVERGAMN